MRPENQELDKMISLFIIQLAGTLVALISILHLPSFTSNISSGQETLMKTVAVIVLFVGILFFVMHKDICPRICRVLSKSDSAPAFLGKVTFSYGIFTYALLDLCALAILIYATGGSRKSLYLPYLLIIVPLAIILEDSSEKVFIYFLLTVIFFWGGIWIRNKQFDVTDPWRYDIWFGAIVSLCVLFPTFLKLFLWKGTKK